MIFKIPHSKFGTIEADVIDNKLVINKVYHFENAKWDTTYKGYDLWKYDTYFAIYRKDNQYIGYGLDRYTDINKQSVENFVDVKFHAKPNRKVIFLDSPLRRYVCNWREHFMNGQMIYHKNSDGMYDSQWSMYNNTTYDYDKINKAFTEGKIYKVLTDAEKLEKDKLKTENWNKATCSVCHRLIQLNGQLIHDHGYKMVGWRSGSCSGVNHQSWEKSPEGKIDLIKGLKNYIENNKNITPQEVKSLTSMIEEHQAMVDEWKPAKTPKELQDKVAQQ
tara:strand:- start:41 stop:868 length:828 start_codon:yes stop_codon:yes gene_type:complete